MRKKLLVLLTTITAILAFSVVPALATMTNFVTYTEKGAGLSIDAVGTGSTGTVSAEIPTGASVYKAFLYSADVWGSGLSNVEFDGNTLVSDASSKVDVGSKNATLANENRWDVTSIVQNKVAGGSGTFDFSVTEMGDLDGEILAVLYNDPTKAVNTAFIFDGELASGGDSFLVNLTAPVDKTDPDFNPIMSLGISFGYQPAGQYSIININGQRLTTSAGGHDDGGVDANGWLITAGGIGDSILNPANPFQTDSAGPRYDDELYSLVDFLNNGDTTILISSNNPSFNDNVFFMGLTTKGEAIVSNVPEPASMLLLGSGLLGLVGLKKKRS